MKLREKAERQQRQEQGEELDLHINDRHNLSKVQQDAIKLLEDELKDIPQEKRQEALIRYSALARLVINFETAYAHIFGSQIKGLQELNSRIVVSEADAKKFYEEEAEKKYPNAYKEFDFNRWLDFLINRGFVSRVKNSVSITDHGREFLTFLAQRGYDLDKAL